MEPLRGPQHRSALLPWEQQFCETLGITAAEYFEYHELVAQHIKEEEGRELIPDIRNEPVTIITLVVGVALSAIGMLLAPKPRAPQQKSQGNSFTGSDIRSRQKFSPLSEFDSVQDLAALGDIVPLVFADRRNGIGGVRVDSQMLWSQMRNSRTYQEMKALMLFSAGTLASRPDYEGFAFGNNKIAGYMNAKIGLFFSRGTVGYEPFLVDSPQQYDEGTKEIGRDDTDPFLSYYPPTRETKMVFCGVVTPSQSAQFGQYQPIRNGHAWKYDFKWPGKGDGDADKKDLIYDTRAKHITGYHPGRTNLAITEGTGAGTGQLTYIINYKDSDKVYVADKDSTPKIRTKDHFGSLDLRDVYIAEERSKFAENSGGVTQGINAINQSKQDADTALDVGELYLFGYAVYRCIGRKNMKENITQGTPFEPKESGTIEYYFDEEPELTLSEDYVRDNVLTDGPNTRRNERQAPIQRLAVGSISTTRAVDMVELGFKSTVYRQINGYPNISEFVNKDQPNEFAKEGAAFDLGTMVTYYDRVSLFRIEFKRRDSPNWVKFNNNGPMFAVHGVNPQPMYNMIRIVMPEKDFWEIRILPVCGNTTIYKYSSDFDDLEVYLLNCTQSWRSADNTRGFEVSMRGRKVVLTDVLKMSHPYWSTGEEYEESDGEVGRQTNPNSLLNDYWYFDADVPSHVNSPEHEITWMNEFVDNSKEWYESPKDQYKELAYAGIICQSSTEISSFSNFSAYFKEGLQVRKMYGPEKGQLKATNNFPEIANTLLTNRRFGVGEMIGSNSVDADRMALSAKFCETNKLYWDGIISDRTNVREFLYQQAGYQFLDFTIIGGQFSLYPSVPFGSDFKIRSYDQAVVGSKGFEIKALFTDGNVRNFKTTLLTPEERQLFNAEVKYRQETANGFPELRSIRVRLSKEEGGYFRDPVEEFDMTQFCTSKDHAIRFAKYALRTRQLVDHGVTFETTPDAAQSLSPGDYIRLGVSIQHQERNRGYNTRVTTGSVSSDGMIQPNKAIDDEMEVYYWHPGTTAVKEGILKSQNGKASQASMRGVLFTRKNRKSEARIYKIESISFTDESFVEIACSYVPVDKSGQRMRVLDWRDEAFVIEEMD